MAAAHRLRLRKNAAQPAQGAKLEVSPIERVQGKLRGRL